MQFYDDFIDSMIRHGMEPMCSLYHFEMPQLLMNKYNGFYSREVVDMFVTYANKMIDRYGDRVKNGFHLTNKMQLLYQAAVR